MTFEGQRYVASLDLDRRVASGVVPIRLPLRKTFAPDGTVASSILALAGDSLINPMFGRFVFLYVDLLLDRVVAVEGDTHRIFAGTKYL